MCSTCLKHWSFLCMIYPWYICHIPGIRTIKLEREIVKKRWRDREKGHIHITFIMIIWCFALSLFCLIYKLTFSIGNYWEFIGIYGCDSTHTLKHHWKSWNMPDNDNQGPFTLYFKGSCQPGILIYFGCITNYQKLNVLKQDLYYLLFGGSSTVLYFTEFST